MIRTSTRAIAVAVGTTAVLALASCAGSTPSSSDGGGGSAPTEMNVLSFSGHLNEVNMEAAKGFEEQFNVKLNWIEGDPAGNVAKVLGSKDNQIYDIAFVDFRSQYAASEEGAWEPLDESIVTNLADISPVGLVPNADGLGYGTYPTGLYYNAEIFESEGWDAPESYQDLLLDEYCTKVGLAYVDDVYGIFAMLGFGSTPGNDTLDEMFRAGVENVAAHKECFPNFESSSGGHDQKILTDAYVTGQQGMARILPMQDSGKDIGFVVPEEGAFYVISTANIAVNAPHLELAQEFINWFAGAEAQTIEMEKSYYIPTNVTIEIPAELAERGLIGGEELEDLVRPFPLDEVQDHIDEWTALWDEAFT